MSPPEKKTKQNIIIGSKDTAILSEWLPNRWICIEGGYITNGATLYSFILCTFWTHYKPTKKAFKLKQCVNHKISHLCSKEGKAILSGEWPLSKRVSFVAPPGNLNFDIRGCS